MVEGLSGWMGGRRRMGIRWSVGDDRQPGRLLRECRLIVGKPKDVPEDLMSRYCRRASVCKEAVVVNARGCGCVWRNFGVLKTVAIELKAALVVAELSQRERGYPAVCYPELEGC